MPYYCLDGLPWDLNFDQPQLDHFLDFKNTVEAGAGYPIFDLNLLSSDLGTEIGSLFYAHCHGLPVKYIELGNEFYLGSYEANTAYPDGLSYVTEADQVAEYIKGLFPDVKISIAAATTKQNDPVRRNTWNNGIETYVSANSHFIDAVSFHIYTGTNLDNNVYSNECDLTTLASTHPEMMDDIFSTPYALFDDLENAETPQKEFKLCDDNNLEGWLTEFNQDDDKFNFHGRWAHGLFTALMALRALEDPNITKATCFELIHSANRSVLFDGDNGFSTDEQICPATPTLTSFEWELGAAGHTLRYIGMATKNAYSAKKIGFGAGFPTINAGDYPGVYGWMFTNGNFTAQDSNWAVIVNVSSQSVTLPTYGLFPLGGQYFEKHQDPDYSIVNPLGFITGSSSSPYLPIENIGNLPNSPNKVIKLPAYSVILLRGGHQTIVGTPHVEASNYSTCYKHPVNLYISCTGATSYNISPAPNNIQYDHPTTIASVTPTQLTNAYSVAGGGGINTVTILASDIPAISPSSSGAPGCFANEVTLDAHGIGSLSYNWYPTPDYETVYATETLEVDPPGDITYTADATNGICYCASQDLFIDMYDTANAGEDIYICTDPDKAVIIGGASSYPGATIIHWTKSSGAPDLSGYFAAQNTLNTSGLSAGTYTYYLLVVYPGLCQTNDVVIVHVEDCCDSPVPALTFNPYAASTTGLTGVYWTATDLYHAIQDHYNNSTTFTSMSGDLYKIKTFGSSSNPIVINGPFYVNANLEFLDCTDLRFGPESKIIIEPNYYLNIHGSKLAACDEMWNGIEMIGNLTQTQGLHVYSSGGTPSHIEGATTAVYSAKDSRIEIEDAEFYNNHYHIFLDNYRFDLDGHIERNDMTSNEAYMLPPYASTRTANGIRLNDIPTTGDNSSYFINDDEITNADTGIYALNTGLYASVCTLKQVNTGMEISGIYGKNNIDVNTNYIDDYVTGIWLVSLPPVTVKIRNNEIGQNSSFSTNSGSSGIVDFEWMPWTNGRLNILSNKIDRFDILGIGQLNGSNTLIKSNDINIRPEAPTDLIYGIFLQNCLSDTITLNNPIQGLGSDHSSRVAIALNASPQCQVDCNTLNNTQLGVNAYDNCSPLSTWGNTFETHDTAFVQGKGYGGGVFGIIGDQPDYMVLDDDSYTSGNIFKLTGGATRTMDLFSYYSNNDVSNTTTYSVIYDDVNVNSLVYDDEKEPNPIKIGFIGSGSDNKMSTLIDESRHPYECGTPIPELRKRVNPDFAEDVLNDIVSFGYYDEQIKWDFKSNLYKTLMAYPEYSIGHSDLSNFIDTSRNGNIGTFYRVDSMVSATSDTSLIKSQREVIINDAIDIINGITPENVMESNLQTIDSIYLNTFAQEIYSFTTPQFSSLSSIAYQCPHEGGEAVFRARALLTVIDGIQYFNDRDLCIPPSPRKSENINNSQLTIYPNPTLSTATILITHGIAISGTQLIINDFAGRKQFQQKIDKDTNIIKLDISYLSPGIYTVCLKFPDNPQLIKKLVVVK